MMFVSQKKKKSTLRKKKAESKLKMFPLNNSMKCQSKIKSFIFSK